MMRILITHPRVALTAARLWLRGRKADARCLVASAGDRGGREYAAWMSTVEASARADCDPAAAMAAWPRRPRLSVIVHQPAPGDLARLFESLAAQCYPDWELVLVPRRDSAPLPLPPVPRFALASLRTDNPARALAAGIEAASGDVVVPLAPGALLAPHALFRLAEVFATDAAATVAYGNHDEVDRAGRRCHPAFKPAWDEDLFLATDYLTAAVAVCAEAARAALPADTTLRATAPYALLLAVARMPGARFVHVAEILAHLRPGDLPDDPDTRRAVVAAHVATRGAQARPGPYDTVTVEWPMPTPAPLVSIIVLGNDSAAALRRTVLGVLTATRYRPFEILVVDSGGTSPDLRRFLHRVGQNPAVHVLRREPGCGPAAAINAAARAARGSLLCLLEVGAAIVEENWLPELVRQAARPEVGAVGARLVDRLPESDEDIRAMQRGEDRAQAAAPSLPDLPVAQGTAVVPLACLAVDAGKFWQAGGLDDAIFPEHLADADLCLKLAHAGLRNLVQPRALLIRDPDAAGPATNPADAPPGARAAFAERWALAPAPAPSPSMA